MKRSLFPLAASAAVILAQIAGGVANAATSQGGAPAKAKAATIAFSNAQPVPTVSALEVDLNFEAPTLCAGKPAAGSSTVARAIAEAKAIEDKAGRAAVRTVDSGRDLTPALAELDASTALADNNPVGGLAALLAAYGKNPKDGTVLRDLGSLLASLGQPLDALALFSQADKVGGKLQHPMGISEAASELNDRGFALLELRRWAAAGADLAKAAADAPLLAEAKLNLGEALLCQGKIPQAAKMIFAGSRRDTYKKVDTLGTETLVPAAEVIDTSHGNVSTFPQLKYPSSMDDVDKDASTITKAKGEAFATAVSETQQAASLLASVTLSQVSQDRISDLGSLTGDGIAGGYAKDENDAIADGQKADNYYESTFAGGGTAEQEMQDIQDAGGDLCTVQRPKMRSWLTDQTTIFHGRLAAWDSAAAAQWTAESRWVSAVYANISNKTINKALALQLDSVKWNLLEGIAAEAETWDSAAVSDDDMFGDCQDHASPAGSVPDPASDHIDLCPKALRGVNFTESLGIYKVKVNCERVSVSFSAPGLGPFVKVNFKFNGDITIVAGVKAGVSLGAASAGVEAGTYVTVHNGSVSDVGLTANAKAEFTVGNINLTSPAATASVSFVNSAGPTASLNF